MDTAKHPYLLTLLGLVLLLAITIVIQTHMPAPAITISDWGAPIDLSSYRPMPPQPSMPIHPPQPVMPATQGTDMSTPINQNPSSFSYNPAPVVPTLAAPSTDSVSTIVNTDNSFDFTSFMQQLGGLSSQSSHPITPTTIAVSAQQDAYPFVPPQLFTSPSTSAAAPTRTDAQQALWAYGNAAGLFIKSYEQAHPDDAAVVQNYFDARGNPSNAAALVRLGNALKNVGVSLKSMGGVPASAESIHDMLASSYIDIGTKLSAVPSAQSNNDVINAINTYDDGLDAYIRNYTALVLLFSQSGVVFGPDEPGSVFMFTNTSL